MSSFPQTPCPFCQQPVNWYAPGCFNCRNPINWPAPTTPEQAQLQQASVAWFQQQLAAYQQAQAQAQPPAPAAPPTAPYTPPPSSEPADPLLERTSYEPVPAAAAAVAPAEGLELASYAGLVPREVPVERPPDLEATALAAVGAPAVATPMPADAGVEMTSYGRVEVQVARDAELEQDTYGELTRSVPSQVPVDPLVESTRVDPNAPLASARPAPAAGTPARRRKAEDEGAKMMCNNCGVVSLLKNCPSCGARTKPLP
ncbi:MAG: hypothetical protein AB2A00_40360 [Myxococcota bacterium]